MEKLTSFEMFTFYNPLIGIVEVEDGGKATKTESGTRNLPDGTSYKYCWDCKKGDETTYCKDGTNEPACGCS